MSQKQLECRIVIFHRRDRRTEIGMYDPINLRYQFLGLHGPDQRQVDKVINDLKQSIERAGHLLTFCERTVD